MMDNRTEDYRLMLTIRRFEEKILSLFDEGNLKGTTHVCIGQEAVAVGVCRLLNKTDWITSTHRGHGHCIAKGGDIKRLIAEIYGKRHGYCGGRGGSQHIFDFDIGFLGANGITGGGIPLALGAAFSSAYRREVSIVVSFIGDGAANQGTFHESLNMAAIWKLPLIVVCENNQYAMSTSSSKAIPTETIAERAKAYGIFGEKTDGNKIDTVRESVNRAIERARAGEGPSLIEAETYRLCGHSKSDRCLYRTKEEESFWKARCPIKLEREKLLRKGISSESLELIEKQVIDMINDAADFAENDLPPDFETLENDVFSPEFY